VPSIKQSTHARRISSAPSLRLSDPRPRGNGGNGAAAGADGIPLSEYVGRRDAVLNSLKGTSGRFTAEQREAYDVVLRAQARPIKAARPGGHWHDVHAAARDVIDQAGHGDAFIHGIGHPLGIEVHDVIPDGPLRPGMVITVEPGVYFPDRKMGIRIEDDVLVTEGAPKNLTASIPKTIEEVEAAMARER
jgi:hypothetical protein